MGNEINNEMIIYFSHVILCCKWLFKNILCCNSWCEIYNIFKWALTLISDSGLCFKIIRISTDEDSNPFLYLCYEEILIEFSCTLPSFLPTQPPKFTSHMRQKTLNNLKTYLFPLKEYVYIFRLYIFGH